MPQSDFMSLQPWIKHINNMVYSLNISQKCCGEPGFCRRRWLFPSRLRSRSSAEISMGQAKIWRGGLTKMKCQLHFGGSPFSGAKKGKSLSLIP